MTDTLIVMPAFNEEASVGDVVREVFEKLPNAHVLVVDDGSSDGTTQAAEKAGAKVATLPFNLGVGGAMRTGFRYALECGYHNVIQIDADGQHDPASVPDLLRDLRAMVIMRCAARVAGRCESWREFSVAPPARSSPTPPRDSAHRVPER
jgi:glycosyltransferase involved in cell wall biosynthesis